MRVKTLGRHGYGKKIHIQGEEYEIKNEKHVRLLEAVGKVRRIPVAASVSVWQQDAISGLEPKEELAPAKVKRKRKKKDANSYQRKDLRAE